MQLFGTSTPGELLTSTIENCTFNHPYRYAVKVTSGNNVVTWKNNTVVLTDSPTKTYYAIEAGTSVYPNGEDKDVDVFNVEGGSYPSSNFIPYYKAFDEGQIINGGEWGN